MTPDHRKYFPDDDNPQDYRTFPAITEHTLFPCVFNPDRHMTDTLKFYRVPNASSQNTALPEVKVSEIQEGDTVWLLDFFEHRLCVMRLVHVTRVDEYGCLYILMNDFLPWGDSLSDRFAGLLGRIPIE